MALYPIPRCFVFVFFYDCCDCDCCCCCCFCCCCDCDCFPLNLYPMFFSFSFPRFLDVEVSISPPCRHPRHYCEDEDVRRIEEPNALAIALFPPAAAAAGALDAAMFHAVEGGTQHPGGKQKGGKHSTFKEAVKHVISVCHVSRLYNPETGMGGGHDEDEDGGTFMYDGDGAIIGMSAPASSSHALGTIADEDAEAEEIDEDDEERAEREGEERERKAAAAIEEDNDEREMTRGEIKEEAQKTKVAALKRQKLLQKKVQTVVHAQRM
jgi:hypothetical protein